MHQKIILLGNLGREPEMRYTPQGTAVTTLNVATSRRYTTANDEKKEETIWWRVSVWGKQAETVNEYLQKGSRIYVEGAMVGDETGSPRIWTDKEGKPRASFEVRADTVRFLSGTKKNENQVTPNAAQGEQNEPVADPF